jgi:hypothetical protein
MSGPVKLLAASLGSTQPWVQQVITNLSSAPKTSDAYTITSPIKASMDISRAQVSRRLAQTAGVPSASRSGRC